MASIYTGKGDTGTSTLGDSQRIPKNDARFALLGDIDELNAHLGLVKALRDAPEEKDFIEKIQRNLMRLSGFICDAKKEGCRIGREDIAALESKIDAYSSVYKRVGFTIPGVNAPSAHAEICRTVCRRAERSFVAASCQYDTDPGAQTYLNRLSDYLYMLARMMERAAAPEGD